MAQVNGSVRNGPDLSVVVNGLKLPNPFVIGSGQCPHPLAAVVTLHTVHAWSQSQVGIAPVPY